MGKVFSFQKNSSAAAMDAPTSRTKVSPTSGAMVSPTSGTMVSANRGTVVSPTSGTMVSPNSGVVVAPTSGALVSHASGALVSRTSGALVSRTSGKLVSTTSGTLVSPTSGALVSPTSGALVSTTSGTLVSPTSGALVSPTSGALVSRASGALVSPTSGKLVSPTSGALVSPTSGALVSTTSGTLVSPTSGALVSPTSGALVSTTSGTLVSPTSGALVSPTSGALVSHASGALVSPTSGKLVSPTSGALVSPTSGALVSTTSGTLVSPTSGALVSPTSGALVSTTSGTLVSPTSGALVSPTSGALVSRTSGALVSRTSGALVSPTSGALVSPTSGALVSPTSGALVSPTSGALVSPTSGALVSPTSGALVSPNSVTVDFTSSGAVVAPLTVVSPTSGAMVSSTSEAIVSPTSQGSGGMEARRPNFQDKGMKAIHKAAREGNKWRMKKILFFGTSDVNATDGMSRTALHVACAYGHTKMVKLLLKRHCIIDNSDCENKTALIYALQYRNTECAQLLLRYLPNLYIKDKDGNTAIHYAALCHSKTVVGMMLTLGADIEAKNKDGLTPLELAKLAKNEKMVEFLITRGAKRNPIKRKQQLTSEYKEESRTQTSQSNNLATDLQESPKPAQNKTKSKTVDAICAEGSFNSKQLLISKYKEEKKPPKSESINLVEDISEEDSLSSKQQLTSECQERRPQTSESTQHVDEISEKDSLRRLSSKSGVDDACLTSHNKDFKDKVISIPYILTAKTSENQSKQIHLPLLHLENTSQESQARFSLEEEKEERQKIDVLHETNRMQLRKKEEHSIKEVAMNSYLEPTIRTREAVSETIRENEVVQEQNYTESPLSQEENARILQDGNLTIHLSKPKEIEITHDKVNYKVSESSDKEKSLLNENRMLWDEIAKLRLQIDTAKNQTQEMGKKHFQDIAIVQEKNDCLQKTIRKTVSQHNEQLEVLRAELIMLNSKLEQEQQNRGRLEEEIESYQYILATAVQDHENCQTSKRDLQLAFQRARDEWISLRDKMNFDVSTLKHNNKMLSEQLSKMESKNNNLEIELHRTRDALKERTLVLERYRSQRQRQTVEIEQVCEEKQGQVDTDSGKQESLQETLSHLHSENLRLHQQLDRAHSKAEREENTAINMQQQILETISICNAESVKHIIKLNERINELINEWHHFKERIHQYENDNIERDAIVRQFQEELAIVRQLRQKMSMTEASLEVESHHPLLFKDKIHELKKEIDESRSQPQHKKEESKKYIDLQVFLQQRLQQEMNKKEDLEKEVTRLKELLKVTKKKLNECDNEELSFPGDSKPSPADIEMLSIKQKQKDDELIEKTKPASSKCICLDEEKNPQQQLTVEELLKECEELKNTAEEWEQELVNLRSHMETNMVESCEVEEYTKKTEERARQDVADKFKQTQRESQEMSQQMISNQASIRRPLELRNKELESELSRVQTSRDDNKQELEKYMQLH